MMAVSTIFICKLYKTKKIPFLFTNSIGGNRGDCPFLSQNNCTKLINQKIQNQLEPNVELTENNQRE